MCVCHMKKRANECVSVWEWMREGRKISNSNLLYHPWVPGKRATEERME